MPEFVYTQVQLPPWLYEQAIKEASQSDLSLSELAKRALENYLKPKDWRDKMQSMETKQQKRKRTNV